MNKDLTTMAGEGNEGLVVGNDYYLLDIEGQPIANYIYSLKDVNGKKNEVFMGVYDKPQESIQQFFIKTERMIVEKGNVSNKFYKSDSFYFGKKNPFFEGLVEELKKVKQN